MNLDLIFKLSVTVFEVSVLSCIWFLFKSIKVRDELLELVCDELVRMKRRIHGRYDGVIDQVPEDES
jgi:hypothetical protein